MMTKSSSGFNLSKPHGTFTDITKMDRNINVGASSIRAMPNISMNSGGERQVNSAEGVINTNSNIIPNQGVPERPVGGATVGGDKENNPLSGDQKHQSKSDAIRTCFSDKIDATELVMKLLGRTDISPQNKVQEQGVIEPSVSSEMMTSGRDTIGQVTALSSEASSLSSENPTRKDIIAAAAPSPHQDKTVTCEINATDIALSLLAKPDIQTDHFSKETSVISDTNKEPYRVPHMIESETFDKDKGPSNVKNSEPEALGAQLLVSSAFSSSDQRSAEKTHVYCAEEKGTVSPEALKKISEKRFVERSRTIAENVVLGPATAQVDDSDKVQESRCQMKSADDTLPTNSISQISLENASLLANKLLQFTAIGSSHPEKSNDTVDNLEVLSDGHVKESVPAQMKETSSGYEASQGDMPDHSDSHPNKDESQRRSVICESGSHQTSKTHSVNSENSVSEANNEDLSNLNAASTVKRKENQDSSDSGQVNKELPSDNVECSNLHKLSILDVLSEMADQAGTVEAMALEGASENWCSATCSTSDQSLSSNVGPSVTNNTLPLQAASDETIPVPSNLTFDYSIDSLLEPDQIGTGDRPAETTRNQPGSVPELNRSAQLFGTRTEQTDGQESHLNSEREKVKSKQPTAPYINTQNAMYQRSIDQHLPMLDKQSLSVMQNNVVPLSSGSQSTTTPHVDGLGPRAVTPSTVGRTPTPHQSERSGSRSNTPGSSCRTPPAATSPYRTSLRESAQRTPPSNFQTAPTSGPLPGFESRLPIAGPNLPVNQAVARNDRNSYTERQQGNQFTNLGHPTYASVENEILNTNQTLVDILNYPSGLQVNEFDRLNAHPYQHQQMTDPPPTYSSNSTNMHPLPAYSSNSTNMQHNDIYSPLLNNSSRLDPLQGMNRFNQQNWPNTPAHRTPYPPNASVGVENQQDSFINGPRDMQSYNTFPSSSSLQGLAPRMDNNINSFPWGQTRAPRVQEQDGMGQIDAFNLRNSHLSSQPSSNISHFGNIRPQMTQNTNYSHGLHSPNMPQQQSVFPPPRGPPGRSMTNPFHQNLPQDSVRTSAPQPLNSLRAQAPQSTHAGERNVRPPNQQSRFAHSSHALQSIAQMAVNNQARLRPPLQQPRVPAPNQLKNNQPPQARFSPSNAATAIRKQLQIPVNFPRGNQDPKVMPAPRPNPNASMSLSSVRNKNLVSQPNKNLVSQPSKNLVSQPNKNLVSQTSTSGRQTEPSTSTSTSNPQTTNKDNDSDTQQLAALVVESMLRGQSTNHVEEQIRMVNELLKKAPHRTTDRSSSDVNVSSSSTSPAISTPKPSSSGTVSFTQSRAGGNTSVTPSTSSGRTSSTTSSLAPNPPSRSKTTDKTSGSSQHKSTRNRSLEPMFVDLTDDNGSAEMERLVAQQHVSELCIPQSNISPLQHMTRMKKDALDIHILIEVVNIKASLSVFCVLERCMWGTCEPSNQRNCKLSHGWWILQSDRRFAGSKEEDVAYVAAQIIARSQHDKPSFRAEMTKILDTSVGKRCEVFRSIATPVVRVIGRAFVRPRLEAGGLYIDAVDKTNQSQSTKNYFEVTKTMNLISKVRERAREVREKSANPPNVVVIAPLNDVPPPPMEEPPTPSNTARQEPIQLQTQNPIVIEPPPTPAPIQIDDTDHVETVDPIVIAPPPTPAGSSHDGDEVTIRHVMQDLPAAAVSNVPVQLQSTTPIIIAPPPTLTHVELPTTSHNVVTETMDSQQRTPQVSNLPTSQSYCRPIAPAPATLPASGSATVSTMSQPQQENRVQTNANACAQSNLNGSIVSNPRIQNSNVRPDIMRTSSVMFNQLQPALTSSIMPVRQTFINSPLVGFPGLALQAGLPQPVVQSQNVLSPVTQPLGGLPNVQGFNNFIYGQSLMPTAVLSSNLPTPVMQQNQNILRPQAPTQVLPGHLGGPTTIGLGITNAVNTNVPVPVMQYNGSVVPHRNAQQSLNMTAQNNVAFIPGLDQIINPNTSATTAQANPPARKAPIGNRLSTKKNRPCPLSLKTSRSDCRPIAPAPATRPAPGSATATEPLPSTDKRAEDGTQKNGSKSATEFSKANTIRSVQVSTPPTSLPKHNQPEYVSLEDLMDINFSAGRDACRSVTSSVGTDISQQTSDHVLALLLDGNAPSIQPEDIETPAQRRDLKIKLHRIEDMYQKLGLVKLDGDVYKITENLAILKPKRNNMGRRLYTECDVVAEDDQMDPEWSPAAVDDTILEEESDKDTDIDTDLGSDGYDSDATIDNSNMPSEDDSPVKKRRRKRLKIISPISSSDDELPPLSKLCTHPDDTKREREGRRKRKFSDSEGDLYAPRSKVKRANAIESDDEDHRPSDPVFLPTSSSEKSSPPSGKSSPLSKIKIRINSSQGSCQLSTGSASSSSVRRVHVIESLLSEVNLLLKSSETIDYKKLENLFPELQPVVRLERLEYLQGRKEPLHLKGKGTKLKAAKKKTSKEDNKKKRLRKGLEFFTNDQLWKELNERQEMKTCVCGMTFLDKGLYLCHKASHDSADPYKCGVCHGKYSDWLTFTSHCFQSHTNHKQMDITL